MYFTHISELLKRHRVAATLACVTAFSLLILGYNYEALPKVICYLLTMIGCFLISEFIYFHGKLDLGEWKIKSPQKELVVVLLCQLIAAFLLIYWFVIAQRAIDDRSIKITVMILRLLFVFPIFYLFYFLAIKRYTWKQIGFVFKQWYIAIPLIIVIGGVSYLGFPGGMQFQDVLNSQGYLAFITMGFLTAAIPEEISRNLFQSRLSKVLSNKSLGWFLASFVWAMVHIPSFGSNTNDYLSATASAVGILPLGLLWGYLNERYKSIIPSILIHGTNLWGLQNIF